MIGQSGSGKSTVIDLIIGLLRPTKGKILIDGTNVEKINNQDWLSQIGYVSQTPFIVDDTLRNNIAFGLKKELIDNELMLDCLQMSQLENFLKNKKLGLDTMLGESGSRISGGQRQRIAIARALYRNPKLLILDEATNAIDSVNERAFIKVLDKLHGKMTTIIIAHKMTSIKKCDEIIVLNEGTIIDIGNFKALKSRCKVFQNLLKEVKNEK